MGHIQFLNCLPLYWGLVHSPTAGDRDLGAELVKDTPDALSDALVRGDLDVGPISLVEFLRHSRELVLLPDLAVGSDGPVQSCVLVTPGGSRPEDLHGRAVALGSTSRTTVLLARMLLEERLGVRPAYVAMPPDLPTMLREADAAVVIGDTALRATLAPGGLHVTDLGAAWREWTGLPMVFAVWAARRDYAAECPDDVAAVHAAFCRGRDLALTHPDEVSAHAARFDPLPAEALADYYRHLDFRLGPRQLSGLREFARRAAVRGEVPARPRLEAFDAGTPDSRAG